MSPRAACRLEQLGVTTVSDYAGGKMDWLAFGLPYEGEADLVGGHIDEIPACAPGDTVGDVAEKVGDAPMCAVVAPRGVLIGALDVRDFSGHERDRAIDITRFGPTTVRPSEERRHLDERMEKKNVARILVSAPDGVLLGVYRRP